MSETCQEQKFNRHLPYPIFARMLSLPPNRIVTKPSAMLSDTLISSASASDAFAHQLMAIA
jgi:hypothetical protein